jgi:hypothetical protein
VSRSQLASGVEVVTVPGRGLAVRTVDGEFLTVRTGDAPEDALLSRLAGGADGPSDAELDRLVGAFGDAGYLTAGPRPARWPAGSRDVRLLGDTALTEPLAGLLRASGAEPRPAEPEDLIRARSGDGPAAVVWCLDGPVPDGLWDVADRLPNHGIAWLRCHREGWQAYVEPLAAAPGDVTSAHVRARRLAATPAHRELAAYWTGPRTSGEPVRLTAPAAALLAALLADDLARWATDTTGAGAPVPVTVTGTGTGLPDIETPGTGGIPARRRLRRVDLRTLTVTDHPVLPVPAVAPMPEKAERAPMPVKTERAPMPVKTG